MPAIVELRLRPSRPLQPATRQLHGLACAVFEGPQAASHVSQDKQFTVWPLNPVPDGWLLRAAWLPAGLPHTTLAACGQLRLGPVNCAVTDLALRPAAHADLAAGPPLGETRTAFHSPTYFAQNGTRVVLPDPRLIAGSGAAAGTRPSRPPTRSPSAMTSGENSTRPSAWPPSTYAPSPATPATATTRPASPAPPSSASTRTPPPPLAETSAPWPGSPNSAAPAPRPPTASAPPLLPPPAITGTPDRYGLAWTQTERFTLNPSDREPWGSWVARCVAGWMTNAFVFELPVSAIR